MAAVDEKQIDGQALIERVRELPGGEELLQLVSAREDAELVGGAARDLLLGATPRELDVVVDGEAEAVAEKLIEMIDEGRFAARVSAGGAVEAHERFGTASASWPGGRIDVAARRAESYAAPGALPDVRPGTAEEDLHRRDFTVNAIAVALGGERRGELRAADGALEDLAERRLRVLHERSFRDDPTRLLRLARYASRLGFTPEEGTARLAREAVAAGALQTISRARFGAELRLALSESDPVAALAAMDGLGALAALHPAIRFDASLARAALAELPPDGRADVLLLAILLQPVAADAADGEPALRAQLDALELGASERDLAIATALGAPVLLAHLGKPLRPSELYEAARSQTLEAAALAAALGEAGGVREAAPAARRWLSDLRKVRLEINGEDLLAAGVAPGREVGERLQRALRRKLDGELADGPEAELSAAMEDA